MVRGTHFTIHRFDSSKDGIHVGLSLMSKVYSKLDYIMHNRSLGEVIGHILH